MNIYFRADANSTIATGHIMRCSAIAKAFASKGHSVKFILADAEAVPMIEQFSFDYYILNSKWNNMSSETDILCAYIISNPCDLFVVDSYYVNSDYFKKLHSITRLAYIDDLCQEAFDIDYIINYSIYANDMPYTSIYSKSTIKLLGTKYIPLRENFQKLPKHSTKKNVKNLLLLTGGTDPYHFALNFTKAALANALSFDIHIVCGVFNEDLCKLKEIEENQSNIFIHVNVPNIEKIMCTADIAISAGGSTTYELAVCGTPTITYSFADNQIPNVLKWHSLKLMEYSGDVRHNFSFDNLINIILKLSIDYEKRKKCSTLLQDGTINPNGASELVQVLVTTIQQ